MNPLGRNIKMFSWFLYLYLIEGIFRRSNYEGTEIVDVLVVLSVHLIPSMLYTHIYTEDGYIIEAIDPHAKGRSVDGTVCVCALLICKESVGTVMLLTKK